MKPNGAKRISARELGPLIRFAAQNRGTIIRLTLAMTRRSGHPVRRHQVERWLHPDPERRTEPLLAAGLLLIEEGRKLMQAKKTK